MKPFRLLTMALFAAATVPRLAHRGMFVDGVTYASIARNLAEGRGRFWAPSYTATLYPTFHEHPPLGFWLQSVWFRLLGDHLFVERLYTLTIGLATALLIAAAWRRLRAGAERTEAAVPASSRSSTGFAAGLLRRSELDWLPVVFWIAAPVVSWAIVGNLLETTLSMFTTAAVLAILTAVVEPANSEPLARGTHELVPGLPAEPGVRSQHAADSGLTPVWSVLSGLCVVAAVLTKGPVGLFPLSAPLIFLLLPDRRRVWPALLAQWTTVVACGWLLWTQDGARTSLTDYFHQQVLAALAGEREVSGSLTIVKTLLQGVLLPMAGAAALAAATTRRLVAPLPAAVRYAWLLVLVGLAGTLPILASAKQAGHYLVPAVPLFALGAALMIGPTVGALINRFDSKSGRTAIYIVCALLTLGTVGASLSPSVGRDRERLADLDAIAAAVPRDHTIGLCPESNGDWGLHAWFERRFQVSLDARTGQQRDWFLQTARATAGCVPARCAPATDSGRPLVLMRCRRPD